MRSIAILVVCVVLALLAGCAKKPPVVAVGQPPAPQAAPQPTPEQPPPAQPAQTQSQGTPPPEPTPTPAPPEAQPTPAEAEKSKPAKPHPGTKKPAESARNTRPKIVVKNEAEPSATPGQISPSISSTEASKDQVTTEQLLQKTENNLNGIKRQLSSDEQAIVAQIRDYMKQSREATRQNDLVRARNLAVKAQLLCDELVKKR
jgi:outer membrane biosynthesis protein TonB